MKRTLKFIMKLCLGTIVAIIAYALFVLIYGFFTDFTPKDIVNLNPEQSSKEAVVQDSVLSFMIWNIGYGGLGKESTFFYDADHYFSSGDKMVISPKEMVEKNISGVASLIKNKLADFYLLQEVDVMSKRSYFKNQFEHIYQKLKGYEAVFATNYNVGYVPLPILQPWKAYGSIKSGLATYSKYKSKKSKRFQLPGFFDFPDYIFQLDRCASLHRYEMANQKELVVVNIHNSAYDKGGVMKAKEKALLKEIFLDEYNKGNYVVAGGDWNQCPPGFGFDSFKKTSELNKPEFNIDRDYLPKDWKWVYDANVPTNRKMDFEYDDNTFVTLIDFFVVSPNLEVLEVKGENMGFEFSDHQPVWLKVKTI